MVGPERCTPYATHDNVGEFMELYNGCDGTGTTMAAVDGSMQQSGAASEQQRRVGLSACSIRAPALCCRSAGFRFGTVQ